MVVWIFLFLDGFLLLNMLFVVFFILSTLCLRETTIKSVCECVCVCFRWHFRNPFFFLVTHLAQWIIISTLDFFFYTKGVIYVVNDTHMLLFGFFCLLCCLVCFVGENSSSLLFVGLDYDVNLWGFDWDYCRTVGIFSHNRLCYQQQSRSNNTKREKKVKLFAFCLVIQKIPWKVIVKISVKDSQKQSHFQMMTSFFFILKLLKRIISRVVCWNIKNVNILLGVSIVRRKDTFTHHWSFGMMWVLFICAFFMIDHSICNIFCSPSWILMNANTDTLKLIHYISVVATNLQWKEQK